MPPSSMRRHLQGRLAVYDCSTIARVDSALRGLRVRRLDGGPLHDKVLDDIDLLLQVRLELMERGRR